MEDDVKSQESRRKFLKTAGKFAVYTPPALMVMTSADAKRIARSSGCNHDSGDRKDKRRRRPKRSGHGWKKGRHKYSKAGKFGSKFR